LGRDGGKLEKIVNLPIVIPSESTARIQEIHILIGHIICSTVEKKLFQ
jgi:D-sedoheptulose 7-phosphate isomerase